MKTIIILVISNLTSSTALIGQVLTDYMGIPDPNGQVQYNAPSLRAGNAIHLQPMITLASPTALPTGLAYYNEYLWVIGYNDYVVYKVSPVDGTVIDTYPIGMQKPYGITFHNDVMYISDNIDKRIVTFTGPNWEATDTIIPSAPIPSGYPTGLAILNERIWINDTKGPQPSTIGDSTYSMSGSHTDWIGFPAIGTFCSGMATDGNALWINDNPSQTINKIDPVSFTILESYEAPGGQYPNGVAWNDENLWIINNSSDSIYLLEPGTTTGITCLITSPISIACNDGLIEVFNTGNENIADISVTDLAGRNCLRSVQGGKSTYQVITDDVQGIVIVSVSTETEVYQRKIFRATR
jgi:glutamine cyclotransferase